MQSTETQSLSRFELLINATTVVDSGHGFLTHCVGLLPCPEVKGARCREGMLAPPIAKASKQSNPQQPEPVSRLKVKAPPAGLAVDGGVIWVSGRGSHVIR